MARTHKIMLRMLVLVSTFVGLQSFVVVHPLGLPHTLGGSAVAPTVQVRVGAPLASASTEAPAASVPEEAPTFPLHDEAAAGDVNAVELLLLGGLSCD